MAGKRKASTDLELQWKQSKKRMCCDVDDITHCEHNNIVLELIILTVPYKCAVTWT